MLLTEKYRPSTLNDYVFVDDDQEQKIKQFVKTKSMDAHLLLSGKPGVGKSSLINVLLNEMGITDYIRYNMSDKTSIDDMRKVIEYASSTPLNDNFKLVILEEFERASPQAQDSLKYVLESYSGWCRFIFTTNNIAKISPAIQSRCQRFQFETLKMDEYLKRIVNILTNEKIQFDVATIEKYIKTYYPDLRASINAIDQHTIDGKLQFLKDDSYSMDKFREVCQGISTLTLMEMKQLLIKNIANEEYEQLYQYLYNHLEEITNDVSKYDRIIVIIAKYLYQNNFVAYSDINFASCCIEIKQVLL